MSEHSVTQAIKTHQETGDDAAAQKIFEDYAGRLLGYAHKKYVAAGGRGRISDEEDIVQNAMDTFFRRNQAGQFPNLNDRDGLWPLLLKLTERKAIRAARDENRAKRGGGRVRGESAVVGPDGADKPLAEASIAQGHLPDEEVESAEELMRLLDCLPDDTLRTVAVGALQGYSNEEIARHLGCSVSTVKQRRAYIRKIWESEGQ